MIPWRPLMLLLCVLLPAIVGDSGGAAARTQKVGVLAYRGEDHATASWGTLIAALNRRVPGETFDLVPLDLEGMDQAARTGTVDFFVTNPGNYAILEYRHGAARLATLETGQAGAPRAAVGAILFSRADGPVRTLDDLAGKRFLAVDPAAFGGFQVAWGVLAGHGLDPFDDMSTAFSGFPLDDIVLAVRDGRADAGTVRACLLEEMAAEGTIDPADFRILAPRTEARFPCALSSPLYPNWPFAKAAATDPLLAKRVAVALLQMSPGEAGLGVDSRWTIPLSYQPVLDLFRRLRIGPFVTSPEALLAEFVETYWEWFALFGALLVLAAYHHARVEHLVAVRTRALRDSQDQVRLRQAELAHVSRQATLGELASGLAHEINQPLGAIGNYAAGCVRRIAAGADARELEEPLREISRQAERAGKIINRIRAFLRKTPAERVPLDVNAVLADAIDLLEPEIRKRGVTVIRAFAPGLPRVPGDRVAVEQVAVNLIRNAIEAMGTLRHPRDLTVITEAVPEAVPGAAPGAVQVSVADTGPVLPPDTVARLFEPFHTTKARGMGLGLSLSRSMVEDHGGHISAAPRPGGGLVVTFTLPESGP